MKNNPAKALLSLFADRGIYIPKSQWKTTTLLGALAQGLLELKILSSGKFGAAMWHTDLLDCDQYPD
jgi:hypothetical protein